MDKNKSIAHAKTLRERDELDSSQEILLELLAKYPDDPLVLFEVGGSYDLLGEEEKAIPYYQQAIEKGLSGEDLQECLVCLGSSLRVLGRPQEAVETLRQAANQFSGNNSGRAFLALAYYSNGQCHEAVKLLLELLLETTDDDTILDYAEPLDYYKDNLDEVYEV